MFIHVSSDSIRSGPGMLKSLVLVGIPDMTVQGHTPNPQRGQMLGQGRA